jgi:type I restriction enzyme, S subunit
MRRRWPIVRLEEVLHQRKEFITIDDLTVYKRPRVKVGAQGVVLRDELAGSLIKTKTQQVCRAGEFLVAEIDAKVGGFGIVPSALEGAIVSSHYFLFVLDEKKLDRQFLDYFIRTPAFHDQVAAQGSTNYAAIRSTHVLTYEMPLPSLGEQQRLVARVEAIAAKAAEARSLRSQVAEETTALIRSELGRLFGDYYNGVRGEFAIKRWERLSGVVDDVADGPHVTPTYVSDGVPFITVLNVTSGRIRFGDNKYITPEEHAQYQRRAKAERGDVLITKDGTIGVPCFVDTDREFSFFVSVALIKPKRDTLNGEFLTWALRIPYIQERIKAKSRGDMIRHLVLREIRDLTVPVPPLPDQRRIVSFLSNMQIQVDELKRLQAETAAELDALMPAILDQAFKGEL